MVLVLKCLVFKSVCGPDIALDCCAVEERGCTVQWAEHNRIKRIQIK
jgi:hypothetical protein